LQLTQLPRLVHTTSIRSWGSEAEFSEAQLQVAIYPPLYYLLMVLANKIFQHDECPSGIP